MGEVKSKINDQLGQNSPVNFVHLHNHTHHSLLDGMTKIDEMVEKTKEFGMSSVAITDHGTLSGAIEFYKSATEAGVKPIIGIETYVASRTRFDRDPQKDKERFHLILLAMNEQGYKNLMILSSKANLEGMYYKPRVDHQLLEEYGEGLIVLSACASGELGEKLRNDDYEGAKEVAKWYQKTFGDRYYIEMQDHGHPDSPAKWDVQVKINKNLEKLATELGIETVVTSDGHYLNHGDKDAHEILLCVGTGSYLSDEKRMSLKDFDLHFEDPTAITNRWLKTNPEAVANTQKIADRCSLEIELGGILIPTFKTPKGEDEKTFLHKLVYRGLAWRYGEVSEADSKKMLVDDARKTLSSEILERTEFELSVIDKMGFNGYFLIVQDFINWGKDRGIIFGPGRGSAAGSIIAYSLKITDLDPLKYDLLFERFLNPDRISMPDIDIDIQDTRRDEVIAYCAQKYGEDHVANIVTFGKMAARAAVRDVARVLEVPYSESDRLSKMIPPPIQGRHTPLKKSVVEDPDLKQEYATNAVSRKVFDYAVRLDGTIRSHGVHAAGVVIAPDVITKYTPVEMSQKGVVATQYPMGPIEDLGLLKMDFLGLSNLTTINNALQIIKKVYKQEIDISSIPLDDKKAYELMQRGDTTGVFQLESAGMKRYLKDLHPESFDDIIAMVALYRPGPMQFIDSFIKRKHGQEKISYLHDGMENSLKNTYGILVYQEQFMQISKEWAGFTGGQADTLRKAVGKKNIDLMRKVKREFVDGAVEHSGVDKSLAEKFWQQLEEFANYCFNKSHAACYGLIAYQTAYLKAHFPDAFMAALMTSDQGDIDRLSIEISECRHIGIDVLLPDINESFVEFAVVPGKSQIRFGLAAVKGVGTGMVEEILRVRKDGKFKSIEDFARRVNSRLINKKAWDSLIMSGSFDEMADRSDLLFNLENIQAFASKLQKEALSGQTDLFGEMSGMSSLQTSIQLTEAPAKHTTKERLTWERELLGLYISAHPLDNYDAYFEEQAIALSKVNQEIDGRKVTVGGLVGTVRTIVTKSGSKMAFVGIEDKTNECEVVVFPSVYSEISKHLVQDAVIRITGKVDAKDRNGNLGGDVKIIADSIEVVTEKELKEYESTGRKMKSPKISSGVTAERKSASKTEKSVEKPITVPLDERDVVLKRLFVHIKNPDNRDLLLNVKKICNDFPGTHEIVLVLGEDKKSIIKMPFKIEAGPGIIEKLGQLVGDDCVKLGS